MDDYKTRMEQEVALMHKERIEKYPGLWSWRAIKSYDEIFKLEAMLKAEGIPFVYHRQPDMCGFQICYPEDGDNRVCSIILHSGSYGREQGLLEIMGLLKPDEAQCDDVVGYLTAEDVFERIKAHYDADDAYQGGLCARRSCCGIGIGHHMDRYGNTEERIIFTVKNFCRGEADIIKTSPWTNTFIGTNKENEKEYSWTDFKQYMQKLSANGSDIWDIEWEYDVNCPMTGTAVADKVHVYLKPEAYKRLFEREEKEEPKQLLKNITDVLPSATKVIACCCTLHYYNLYFDHKSDLKCVNDKHINRSVRYPVKVKGSYYIQVVSYNKELPKNISSATLVWDQEENRYSVEDFTIKKEKKVWISTDTLWSNDDYLARVPAVTPPPVPTWLNLDKDCEIGFRQKDVEEVKNEIDEMTKKLYEKLEIKQVKDFDTDTAWYEYLSATETELFIAGCKKKEVKNKEEKNMEIKWADFEQYMQKLSDKYLTAAKLSGADFDGDTVCEYCKRDVDICKEMLDKEKDANNKEEKNMRLKDVSPKTFYRRLYGEYINAAKIKPTKILIQGIATIIWWSDNTKTIVKCQKGDKMDPEKGIAMCVMKKFMGTNETHSNYLDFAKDAIAEYEKQQAAEKAKKKAEYDKKRREAAKKKGTDGNANYKRTTKKHPIETLSDAITALAKETNADKEES